MATVTADPAVRVRPGTSPAPRVRGQVRVMLAGLLIVLTAVLIVDNHVMALPGSSFADIGVTGALLDNPALSLVASRRAAPDGAGAAAPRSTGRSAHELHRCFVHARRSGRDPATCRTGP